MAVCFFLFADNQDVTRAGLRHYVATSFADAVAVDVRCAEALRRELARRPEAVVVLDYAGFDLCGLDAVVNLRQRFPLSRWVMFSQELTQEALRLFAAQDGMSIVLKENSEDEIRSALGCAMRGERFLCHQVANLLLREKTRVESRDALTPSEAEILKLIAKGRSVKDIAAERNCSVHTVIAHKKNIFRKIEVNNVYEATRYALQAGLVDLMEYYI